MHARLDRGAVRLLTRTGLDWTGKYPAIAAAVEALPARQAYLDGELCGVRPDGTTSFSLIQNASDSGNSDALVFFLFDLLHLDGEAIQALHLRDRKERLQALLSETGSPLHYSDHQIGRGQAFYDRACALKVEGIVSKQVDAPYAPGKSRALHVIQHTDRNLSSSHTRGTRFTANAFASTVASDVPAVRSCTSRCSQVFPEKFQHGCAMLRCAQRYRRGRPGLQSRP
jgi:ATP dependent DNA ligase domain